MNACCVVNKWNTFKGYHITSVQLNLKRSGHSTNVRTSVADICSEMRNSKKKQKSLVPDFEVWTFVNFWTIRPYID